MKPIISTLMSVGAAIGLCCVFGLAANAQGKIAICPVVFDNGAGSTEAQAEAIRAMRTTLEQGGFTVVEYDSGKTTWNALGISMPTAGQPPASSDLTRFGQAVGADYVLTAEYDFDANRTWKVGDRYTTVKVTMNVFNVPDGAQVYDRTETISKTVLSPGDFATLSKVDREQRVVDQTVDVSLAGFTRKMKLILH